MPRHFRQLLAAVLAIGTLLWATTPGAETRGWKTVPGKGQAGFDATFSLGNFSGRTEEVSGEFQADVSDLRTGVTGVLRINAGSLKTGIDARDRDMAKLLAADRYPEIRFTIEKVDPSFPSVTDRSDVLLTVTGRMRIRGQERPMVVPSRVRFKDDKVWVRGEAELRMSEFGIDPPARMFVKVGDALIVSFDVLLAAGD